ncbi:hypothetical protein ACWOCB_07615 [Gemella haemolysans]|uniref:Uncharacterized protein n=1 Tax=Gemella haemolysans ATCC 10379 TaxID=546270 RepID=C5NZ15_9BACL|nr:hypothetical protein [Gemella haemolysans]EER67567.1 hypothetical protein GEMHA0001_0705 [Gemella haemolysans ATCC 10379]KAA8706881.1 hypothetical protein F4V11_07285 [Gemella haemolysans]UBH83200.1 hypothetical protein LA340_04390 [Gemella haemolysans]VEI38519.1 Uncharacterised protein [Gemella haemolysans]
MIKIRTLFKNLLESILNFIKEEENMKKEMPIRDIDYFDTLIKFLLDNSNNNSGLNFYNRLEKHYLDIIEDINKERKLANQEVYIPYPNFSIELQHNININWIRNEISNIFLQLKYDNTSYYRIFIRYKLEEAENNNIQDTEYIKNIFNNYCHNMMIFPKLPIFCTEVAKENRYLVFTFIHYGKHKEIKTKEIDFHDEDFY